MDLHPSIDNKYYMITSGIVILFSKILAVKEFEIVNSMLAFIFYGLGIIMFLISLYEWNIKRIEHNKKYGKFNLNHTSEIINKPIEKQEK